MIKLFPVLLSVKMMGQNKTEAITFFSLTNATDQSNFKVVRKEESNFQIKFNLDKKFLNNLSLEFLFIYVPKSEMNGLFLKNIRNEPTPSCTDFHNFFICIIKSAPLLVSPEREKT